MKITVFWDVTPRSLVDGYQRFGGNCCLHLQYRMLCREGKERPDIGTWRQELGLRASWREMWPLKGRVCAIKKGGKKFWGGKNVEKDLTGIGAKVRDWMVQILGRVSRRQVEFPIDRTTGSRDRATTASTCAPLHRQLKGGWSKKLEERKEVGQFTCRLSRASYSSALKMKEAGFSMTLVSVYQITRCHIPEYRILHSHHLQNLESLTEWRCSRNGRWGEYLDLVFEVKLLWARFRLGELRHCVTAMRVTEVTQWLCFFPVNLFATRAAPPAWSTAAA
jgi:hypothetical protein